jgi:hypothetical protein
MWENIDRQRHDSVHYSVLRPLPNMNGMAALRQLFPDGEANDLNAVLFSTSGVHGTYNTIEEAERHLAAPSEDTHGEVTFLVVHPRLVALRYGVCTPENSDDIAFLKRLRSSSHAAFASIGAEAPEPNSQNQQTQQAIKGESNG